MQTTRTLQRIALVAVVAVGLVGAFVGARHLDAAEAHPDSVEQRLADDPAPPLFSDTAVSPVVSEVAGSQAQAHALLAQWWASHGHRRDDKAFTTWLAGHVPAPPSSAQRTAQLSTVAKIARTRTPAQTRAARWLATHGGKDVWLADVDAQTPSLSTSAAAMRDRELKRALLLSKDTATRLAARLRQSAPEVLRPSLRPAGDKGSPAPGATCPCSYPSHFAATGAAAQTFLSSLDPARQGQYTRMEAQVDYSRLYLAGGLPSDLDAGALVGDAVAGYVLGTK